MNPKQKMIGIGLAQDHNPSDCGQKAARMALDIIESPASWAMVFCGGRHNPEAVLKGLRSELGDVDIVGGSAVGAITNSVN